MLLSIVMMVKNEEKYLDKTLYSLQNLMNDIDSELIILDTGSTDKTIDIAKKYTQNVYFEKWNNNFSDMRNISISYASGEWILILDADEELINYEKLKEFFESDLHYKYNSASIELKNIYSEDEKVYSLASILRLFKNDDFKFSGAIHEQPKYKLPIYNDVASFKHYGYMFKDEILRQKKIKRNGDILLEQIKKMPEDPYTNYQLGKHHLITYEYDEACFYIEKAYNLYKKHSKVPRYIYSDLAKVYIDNNKFVKCEELCLKYIKHDKNNIDIYYYLAVSQKRIWKHQDSIKNYERYLYLLENYNLSTQSKHIDCDCSTVQYEDVCKLSIIQLLYILENYEEVINKIKKWQYKNIREIYYIVIFSLYKLDKIYEIEKIYNNVLKSTIEQNKFFNEIERLIKKVKVEDKEKIYDLFLKLDNNYGELNRLRKTNNFDTVKCNQILNEENEIFYGEIIEYALKANTSIEDILKNISYIKVEKYLNYLIANKKEYITNFYEHLENSTNTLDLERLKIYILISKSLLQYGNLSNDKYKIVFLTYLIHNYNYLKSIYSCNLNDEELVKILRSKEEVFIIEIISTQKIKDKNTVEYIRKMKNILLNNPEYKKGIEILINSIEENLNSNNKLNSLKQEYKGLIEESLNQGNIENSIKMIDEYESIFKEDLLLNFRAIVSIYKSEFEKADYYLKQAYIRDNNDYNIIFNIAYVKELLGETKEAERFYSLLLNSDNPEIKIEAKNRLSEIKSKEL